MTIFNLLQVELDKNASNEDRAEITRKITALPHVLSVEPYAPDQGTERFLGRLLAVQLDAKIADAKGCLMVCDNVMQIEGVLMAKIAPQYDLYQSPPRRQPQP